MRGNGALNRAGLALALLLVAAPAVADPLPVVTAAPATLPAPAARQLGLQVMQQGRPDLALPIAEALIDADASDTFAWYLKANALFQLGRMAEAQAAAKRSYRFAQSPEQSYQAARLTALAAYEQAHYGAAQWWLRRAAQYAPEAARRDLSIAEFNAVKRKNPLRMAFSFSLVPSDNVNNGSSGGFNIIDGVPYVGTLSPDARALPGWIGEATVDLQYRLAESQTGSTWVGLYLFGQEITLSDAARADLDGYPEPDLGARRGEVSLRRIIAAPGGRDSLTLGVVAGLQQEGGVEEQSYGRLHFGYLRALDATSLFNIAGSVEQREAVGRQEKGDRVYTLRGSWLNTYANADVLTATLFASRYQTGFAGQSSNTFGGDLSYDIGRDFGPVNLAMSAGAYRADFAGYTLATITVPGGRQDVTGYLALDVAFPDVEYSGFAPVLSLRRQVTSSNVSRFDAVESSISLGVESVF